MTLAWAVVPAAVVLWTSAPAHACSYDLDPRFAREFHLVDETVPANRVFVVANGDRPEDVWDQWSGPRPTFVVDETMTAWLRSGAGPYHEVSEAQAFRIVDPEASVGLEARSSECTECGLSLGPLDIEAPGRPVITDLSVTTFKRTGGGGFACPNIDTMDLRLALPGGAPHRLRLAAFFGDDPDEALAVAEPELVWQPPELAESSVLDIALGEGGGRRDGAHFRRRGEFCFSLSASDPAGNESERSEPVCIDTLDTSDPRVSRGGCSVGGPVGGGWLLFVGLLALGRSRAANRRGRLLQ